MSEHDRTSCDDNKPHLNADGDGSRGCALCTNRILKRDRLVRSILVKVDCRELDNNAAIVKLMELYPER